jgi:tetratricopeptide (TPR) repeat protein
MSGEDSSVVDSALDSAWVWVEGSEAAPLSSKPPFLMALRSAGPKGALLAQGVEDFLAHKPEEALVSFDKFAEGSPPDHRVLSLLAAAHLRLLNYGRAKALYTESLDLVGAPPETGGLKEASDRLGLALSLFHQPDHEASLAEASRAWHVRSKLLGPSDPKTLAALNATATSLMALSRSAMAGDLLLEAVARGLDAGVDKSSPVMRDTLGILYLAFEAQGRLPELDLIFQAPETGQAAKAGQTAPAGQTGADGRTAGTAPPGPETPAQSMEQAAQTARTDRKTPPPQTTRPDQAPRPTPAEPARQETEAELADMARRGGPPSRSADPSAGTAAPEPAGGIDRVQVRELMDSLQSVHPESSVLPALALALAGDMTGGQSPPCRGPYPARAYGELARLCLAVAQGYAKINELSEAATILDHIASSAPEGAARTDKTAAGVLLEANVLNSALREAGGDLEGAAESLRSAREIAATLPGTDEQTLTSLIIITLRLSDIVRKQGRPPIEAEMELVSGLTAMRKIASAKDLENHPLSPVLYLRLANLVGSMGGRSKEANAYRGLAGKSLAAALKSHPEHSGHVDAMTKVFEGSRGGRGDDDSLGYLWKATLPAERARRGPGSPDSMRLELTALKLLRRIDEFGPMISQAVAWSAETHGAGSPAHRRYQSLNLKYLEESGDMRALLKAIDGLIADPGTVQEPDRTTIMVAALKYKARILEQEGDVPSSLATLNQALVVLMGNPALVGRVPEVEAEINRLENIGR